METTATRENRDGLRHLGRPMERQRRGHEGVGVWLAARRQRYFEAGLLSDLGNSGNYLVFQPSRLFVRGLGDAVPRLAEGLAAFRSQAADHVLFLDAGDLEARYTELDGCIEEARDKLLVLTDSCNMAFEGRLQEALERLAEATGKAPSEGEAPRSAGLNASSGEAAYEVLRRQGIEQGILTELGREQGLAALPPCPFYGRFMGEIVYTVNGALGRLEGRTSAHIAGGHVTQVRQYYEALQNCLAGLRADLEGIVACCRREVGLP